MDELLLKIKLLMTEINLKIEAVTKLEKSLPKGYLNYHNTKHGLIIYRRITEKGRRKRITITKDRVMQLSIAKRIVAEQKHRDLCVSLAAVERAYNEILEGACQDYRRYCSAAFSWMDASLLEDVLKDDLPFDEWAEAYEQSSFLPEYKTKVTSKGLHVRSKSELIIAEKLYSYNLPFRYEQILRTDNSMIVPDFTIKRSDGKIFYWEHEGLNRQKSYAERQRAKSEQYYSMGIVPWDNLIVTYDDKNGDIDLRIVESEIKNKLLLQI